MAAKERNEVMLEAADKKGTSIQSFLAEGCNVNYLNKVEIIYFIFMFCTELFFAD